MKTTSTNSPTLSKPNPTFLPADLKAAPVLKAGTDYSSVVLPARVTGGTARYYGRTDAGLAYGAISGPDTDTAFSQTYVVLTDVKTLKRTVLSDAFARPVPTMFDGMTANDRYVVWLETSSASLFESDWKLYSYEFASRKTRLLARAPEVGIHPAPMPQEGTVATISGNNVYITAVAKMRAHESINSIYSVPVDGSDRMKMVVNDARVGRASRGTLAYLKSGKLYLRNIATGVAKAVPDFRAENYGVTCGWQFNEGTLALCFKTKDPVSGHDGATVRITGADGNTATVGPLDMNVGAFNVTSRWVSFAKVQSGGVPVYVYDLKSHSLSRATSRRLLSSPEGSGNAMTWLVLPKRTDPIQSIISTELVRLN